MIPVKLILPDEKTAINTSLIVMPEKGSALILDEYDYNQFDDATIKAVAELINAEPEGQNYCEPYPLSINGPVENYKAEVISFMKRAIWFVQEITIGVSTVSLFVTLED